MKLATLQQNSLTKPEQYLQIVALKLLLLINTEHQYLIYLQFNFLDCNISMKSSCVLKKTEYRAMCIWRDTAVDSRWYFLFYM